MTTEHVDLNRFIVDRLDAAYRWIEGLSEGITDEQFYYQPTNDANSIAWLVWHLSRWRDRISAIVTGEGQVWISAGGAQRFDMADERVLQLTPEQFDQQVEYVPGDLRSTWRVLAGVIGDSTEHVGQINYLRGMTAGLGWR